MGFSFTTPDKHTDFIEAIFKQGFMRMNRFTVHLFNFYQKGSADNFDIGETPCFGVTFPGAKAGTKLADGSGFIVPPNIIDDISVNSGSVKLTLLNSEDGLLYTTLFLAVREAAPASPNSYIIPFYDEYAVGYLDIVPFDPKGSRIRSTLRLYECYFSEISDLEFKVDSLSENISTFDVTIQYRYTDII